jgi:hypothetical protein
MEKYRWVSIQSNTVMIVYFNLESFIQEMNVFQ